MFTAKQQPDLPRPRYGMAMGACALLLALSLSACSVSPPGPPGANPSKPPAVKGAAASPGRPAVPRPSGPAGPGKSAIALAGEIVAAGANPFLSKLPKPQVEMPTAGPGEAPAEAPAIDVAASFQLLGVVAKASGSMALLSLGTDVGTEMVRAGDMFFAQGNQFTVKRITNDAVDLEKQGPAPEVVTLTLPGIVGYGTTGAGGDASGGGVSAPASSPGRRPGQQDGSQPRLQLEEL